MQISCPKCSEELTVDERQRDEGGRVRMRCDHCNAKLLIKVNAPSLKLDENIPANEEPDEDSEDMPLSLSTLSNFATDIGLDEESLNGAGNGFAPWVVVVDAMPELEVSELRRLMMRIPRFSRNLNKLHDLTSDLPFVLGGIDQAEARRLGDAVLGMSGDCRVGPEYELLTADGGVEPRGEPEEGLLIAGDEDDDADEDLDSVFDELMLGADDSADHDTSIDDPEPAPEPEPIRARPEPPPLEVPPPKPIPEPKPAPAAARTPFEPLPEDLAPVSFDDLLSAPPRQETPRPTGPTPLPPLAVALAGSKRTAAPAPSPAVLLATADSVPKMGKMIGLVTASMVLSADQLTGSARATVLAAALRELETELEAEALQLDAGYVVGIRTSSVPLPDGGLLMILQGTATQ